MPDKRLLQAGPLQLHYLNGDLRRIMLGDREVLCRIYFALRDSNWGTIGGRIEHLTVDQRDKHFSITYDSIHQQDDIDFRWHATITGTAAGKINFALDGKAHSSFLRNRIGFCVHHPLAGCAGKPCTVTKPDGRRETSSFPDFVAPNQPFLDVAAITHEVQPGVEAEVRFRGETFETEDHRNWTDANFKTYGTPLKLPFPVEVKAGTELHQMVELTLIGKPQSTVPPHPKTVTVAVSERIIGKLPELGLGPARDGKPLTAPELEQLKRLHLSHLRVDVTLDGNHISLMERSVGEARTLGVGLEAAIFLPGPIADLRRFAPSVKRWLIFDKNEKATTVQTADAARQALGPEAVIVAGTNAYFAELNRNRPQGSAWNATCFSCNPQVHAFDDDSVIENVAAQGHAVRSASHFTNGKPVVVSPVTLRPRFNPDATTAAAAPPPDPRQKTPFCASWTVGSVKSLAESGAASVTYFETHGPGGVLDDSRVFPVFEVLEKLGTFSGASLLGVESSDSRRVFALALVSGQRRRLLLANQTSEPQTVRIDTRSQSVDLAPYATTVIDWNAA